MPTERIKRHVVYLKVSRGEATLQVGHPRGEVFSEAGERHDDGSGIFSLGGNKVKAAKVAAAAVVVVLSSSSLEPVPRRYAIVMIVIFVHC